MRDWPMWAKGLALLAVLYVLKDPVAAAGQVNRLAGGLSSAGDSLGTFVSHLGK